MNTFKFLSFILFAFLLFACEDEKIDVEKYGGITGTVLDADDYTPLQGVQIVTNPASSVTITGDNGAFDFLKVLEGEVAISARKKDYLSNSVSIAVYEGEVTNLTFFLLKDENDVGWVEIYDPVPGNGAIDQNISFTFQWQVDLENTGNELEYMVYFYESNSTVQKIAGENLTTTEVVVAGLDYNTTYYWYVVAKNEGKRVANSPTWTFRTKASSDS